MNTEAHSLVAGVAQTARRVGEGAVTATRTVAAALARIDAGNAGINAFTGVLPERALARAARLDAALARGEPPPPLAGVPFAVKNLFDVQGAATLAGSRIERDSPPAAADATAVARLEAAGAVLVGALNMDEYAYGFSTENSHFGATRNPHAPQHIAGGSSGGSAAAVAAGLVPASLGTDTNGSIRVPASLCGIFGLRPTFGRLSRAGSYPFVASLDTIGPFARSAEDLALLYDAMQGPDPRDPGCAQRAPEPVAGELGRGADGLRIARLAGYFDEQAQPEAVEVAVAAARALGADALAEWPDAELGRGAAFVITAAEGAALHIEHLRTRYDDMEPLSRARFLAGALIPAGWVHRAQRFRRAHLERVLRLFAKFDVLIAPATPCVAPPIGEDFVEIRGRRLPMRPSMGLLTQPVSCVGLPVVSVPIRRTGLPIGVQLIAAPWMEARVLRVAAELERAGATQPVLAT